LKSETHKNEIQLSADELSFILSPKAIRQRAQTIFDRTLKGEGCFTYHADRLDWTVQFVIQEIKQRYPSLDIPFHSRWGHFAVGGIARKSLLMKQIQGENPLERARILLDLVITSVLLDAGAGSTWKFYEESSKSSFGRSEGLGVASFYLFLSGFLSSDPHKPLRADALGLKQLRLQTLETAFQVSPKNPLVGAEGRLLLLNNLADAVSNHKRFKDGRPGNILDYLMETYGERIPAEGILRAVLEGLGSIWPGRLEARGVNLGDVWPHSKLGANGSFDSLVPFHKLSQWMTYSLIEPILEAGLQVDGVDTLTGLAEYRNGGLMIDSGLIQPRDPQDLVRTWPASSEFIIEWRALTIHLLDVIGEKVRKELNKSSQDFPLAKVLEGGTWWAGRKLAARREGGVSPVQIQSDGTVF
jgi:hypothetical protein